jgi:hypothetical protein
MERTSDRHIADAVMTGRSQFQALACLIASLRAAADYYGVPVDGTFPEGAAQR